MKWLKTINLKKRESASGQLIGKDMRGRHGNRPNKISEEAVNLVHLHINLFPRVESHYCRSSTTRLYLNADLNVARMYRLYNEWMADKDPKLLVSLRRYRYIFNHDFNLFFHRPKKDQCDLCSAYHTSKGEEKAAMEEKYQKHRRDIKVARDLMAGDKNEAKSDKTVCAASFDLEKVLNAPKADFSALFYKRKVSIYNFTVYNLATNEGYCYVWNETVANRGGNEISSLLYKFIVKKVECGVKTFKFTSDNCIPQNKNQMVFTVYVMLAVKFQITIIHKYVKYSMFYTF